jgi:hypothetical protein
VVSYDQNIEWPLQPDAHANAGHGRPLQGDTTVRTKLNTTPQKVPGLSRIACFSSLALFQNAF